MKQSVLFVCLGNICRSPLAEAALRQQAEALDLALEVDSAGTGNWHAGEPPDPRAQAVARRHGVSIEAFGARQVQLTDFQHFDQVVALDHRNLSELQALRPADARAELSLLLDHVPGREGQSVSDPYYGDAAGFEQTWAEVSAGAAALLKKLMASSR